MNAEEYVKQLFNKATFTPEDELVKVIHYSWCEHNENGELLKQSASLLFSEISKLYPNCTLTIKEYAAPNQEYNVQISVRN
jgi:hypothetical protein